MAALISQNTNLKSLRYGKDRPGGGNSNQPYIQTTIQGNTLIAPGIGLLGRGTGGTDFLLRGGTLTPSRAAKDVSRLTKMFFDFKSPNGVLFTAKQNLLSRTNVKTQASGILNQGAYLPTSTLLQVAGNAFGIHLNKQGINPFRNTSPDNGTGSLFGLRDPLGLNVYAQVIKNNQDKKDNRLVQLANRKLNVSVNDTTAPTSFSPLGAIIGVVSNILSTSPQISSNPNEILNYGGGPGSILGVGKTSIKRYSFTDEGKTKAATAPKSTKNVYGKTFFPNITPAQTVLGGVFALGNAYRSNLYTNTNSGLDFDIIGNDIFKGKYYVLDSSTVFKKTKYELSSENTQISDFRTQIPSTQIFAGGKKNILSAAPDYATKNIENRVNLGDPGKRSKDVSSYTKGTGDKLTRDLITAMPLYQSSIANHGGDRNDLVKFSIGIIDNDSPNNRTYIHFRAFLDLMDDNYNAQWENFKYMGRGENFYRYNGFTRTVNLSWTIAAQSKEELIPMYQKLNFLASSLAPDYSAGGYMRGNLAVITIGGYLFDQPGIINSINYSVPTESPWEIGINDGKDDPVAGTKYGYDKDVKELPHIIKVTGFSFTPIHKFVPKLQKNAYGGTYDNKDGTPLSYYINSTTQRPSPTISEWGKERFIALATSTGRDNNYDDDKNYTFGVKGIVGSNPLPSPSFPKIPPPTSLARRGSISNAVPVPARNSVVASPVQPPINTNAAIEDIRQATQIRNLRF
jgi:hypothetical protein